MGEPGPWLLVVALACESGEPTASAGATEATTAEAAAASVIADATTVDTSTTDATTIDATTIDTSTTEDEPPLYPNLDDCPLRTLNLPP